MAKPVRKTGACTNLDGANGARAGDAHGRWDHSYTTTTHTPKNASRIELILCMPYDQPTHFMPLNRSKNINMKYNSIIQEESETSMHLESSKVFFF